MPGSRAEIPEALAFAFMPPAIPGLGIAGGFTMWLQDRSGGSIEFLDRNVQKFLAAARKRPELAGVYTLFSATSRRYSPTSIATRCSARACALGDVYQTLQTFLGGLYVNQFNRFGRVWRVFLQADGADRTSPGADGRVLRTKQQGRMLPLSAVHSTQRIFGPQFTNRFNVYRAVQINGAAAPGYSSGQAMAALEEVARDDTPPGDGLRLGRPVVSGDEGRGVRRRRRSRCRCVFVFLILAALYESWSLPFSVLLDGAGGGARRLPRIAAAQHGLRRLCADRPGRAHRPRGEERHPDRRVREGPAGGGPRSSSTPRSRARSSACARS